jgi:hypothetical protein
MTSLCASSRAIGLRKGSRLESRFSWSDSIALLSGLGLLGYAAERARRIGITYDEALTYLVYVRRPVHTMFTYAGGSANNHLLNSLAMKLLSALFGPSEFVLRLPNLAGLATFLVFSWLLLRRYASSIIALSGFLATSANPLLLEFFSVARGYGLALGLAIPGLYFLAKSIEGERQRVRMDLIAFILLALSAIASFTCLIVFVASGLGTLIFRYNDIEMARQNPERRLKASRELIRSFRTLGAISFSLFAGVGLMLIRLKRRGQLYYGGHSGFWPDTIRSLVDGSLYDARYAGTVRPVVLTLVVVAFSVVAAGAVVSEREVEGARSERAPRLIALIAVTSVGISISQHFLLGTLYLKNRTALFFIPLFGLAVILNLARFATALPKAGRVVITISVSVVATACIIHLLLTANVRSMNYVAYDLEMLHDLDRWRASDHKTIVRLGVSWVFVPQVNYYRVTRRLDWLLPVTTRSPFQNVDYCFVVPSDQQEAVRDRFVVINNYPSTGNELLRGPRDL